MTVLQSELQKLKDKKDEFNIETLKTIFLELTKFEEFKNEVNTFKNEVQEFKNSYLENKQETNSKLEELKIKFLELEAKIYYIDTDNFVKISKFENFKNELNEKLKDFDNTKIKNDILKIKLNNKSIWNAHS